LGIAYRYLDDADVIVTVWDGVVTAAQWSEAVGRQVDSPAWLRGKRRLTDARTADTSAITAADVKTLSANYDLGVVNSVRARLAIVANEGWAIAQHVEAAMRALGISTVVFNDVHTACAWLGVDAGVVSTATNEIRQGLRTSKPATDA
jgi:hypothetical protein